jgi:hypothetical protein
MYIKRVFLIHSSQVRFTMELFSILWPVDPLLRNVSVNKTCFHGNNCTETEMFPVQSLLTCYGLGVRGRMVCE